jgi:hypothetical protein
VRSRREHGNDNSGCIHCRGNCWVSERLSASEEVLSAMLFVTDTCVGMYNSSNRTMDGVIAITEYLLCELYRLSFTFGLAIAHALIPCFTSIIGQLHYKRCTGENWHTNQLRSNRHTCHTSLDGQWSVSRLKGYLFYPEDVGETFLRNVGFYNTHIQENAIPHTLIWAKYRKASCKICLECWSLYCLAPFPWPPLWYSGQSSCLQIRRPGFDSRHYQKKKVVGLERGTLSLVNTNWGATW